MRRRDFIALIGGPAMAWPLEAYAQQGERMRRIGTLLSGREADPEMQTRIGALREGLKALGWVEGRNYKFEHRWPGSDPEQIRTAAAEMVRVAPDPPNGTDDDHKRTHFEHAGKVPGVIHGKRVQYIGFLMVASRRVSI